MHFFHPIEQSAPHIYHSALPLSPTSSVLRSKTAMFRPKITREETPITEFYGRPGNWGSVIRTIKGDLGGFTCTSTIGYRIAAACRDGTVGIYDSVTGVLRLSLNPADAVEAMRGFPDGSILSCMHRDNPSITLWDIQTGGLIHTFTLEWEPKDIAVSSKGRYLACGLSDGSVRFWEVASKLKGSAFRSGLPIINLCWLAPEEQLMVANEASVHIRDVVAGRVLHSFDMQDPVCGAAYFQKLNQLAIVTRSGAESITTFIDPHRGTSSPLHSIKGRSSYLTFFQTTGVLVYVKGTRGLLLFDISKRDWKYFHCPAAITSVSTLSNGIVVVNATDFGIQLLSLDMGDVISQQHIPPVLAVHPSNEGGVVAIVPTNRDRVILLELATMSQVLTIPARENCAIPTEHAVVLCVSLKNKMAVYWFKEGGKVNLQMWKFYDGYPAWTMEMDELPSVARISPAGARLVTYHNPYGTYLRIWDVKSGKPLDKLRISHSWLAPPLDIEFDWEDEFYCLYDTYRIRYGFSAGSIQHNRPPLIIRLGEDSLVSQAWKRQSDVDDSCEWVVRGSERICWIPPGYIGSLQASHCWTGSSLVMAGQDGTLRVLTFD